MYTRECTMAELTHIQIEVESLLKNWISDDIKLNFSTLAIIEVLANIFEHGAVALDHSSLNVVLSISQTDSIIIASIEDNTPPIPDEAVFAMTGNSNQMPATDVSEDSLPVSGWGLNLVQHATTTVKYERQGKFNYLELTFACDVSS